MSVTFISSVQKIYVERSPEGTRNQKLTPAIYTLEVSREEGFFLLNIQDKYTLPEKTYGNHEEAAKRVIHTHLSRKGNTGILLTGLKGTGKSLFVKTISNLMIDLGYPVIQITKAFKGEDLFNFIENLGDCVLLFDEFGKNYSPYNQHGAPTQNSLLSVLDGLSNGKRMHLFTENSIEDISQYMINRPGRVHYHFKYNRLSKDVVKELCADYGLPEEVTNELIELSTFIKVLSFDVVKCIIEEWKLYGGELKGLLETLNITLVTDSNSRVFEVISYVDKNGAPKDHTRVEARLSGDTLFIDEILPSSQTFGSGYGKNEDSLTDRVEFNDVIGIDDEIYTFKSKRGNIIVIHINTPIGN